MTNQQAPEIYTLHTVPNKGERPWSGIYTVRADAEHDAKVMRDVTGRDWSVVRLVVADTNDRVPEALFYADAPDRCAEVDFDHIFVPAAAVIRRLHAENERLAALVEAQQPAPSAAAMSPINRLIAYSAATTLRGLGYQWDEDTEAWKLAPSPTPQADSQPANKDLLRVALAYKDYIDALPSDVVAALPAMPGIDGDWAAEVLDRAARAPADSAPAWASQAVIEYRYTGGTHWCQLGPAERMKPNFDGVYRLQGGVFPVDAPADSVTAPAADSYVQPVPDKCDRIVWRDHYYHLPLTPPAQAADSQPAHQWGTGYPPLPRVGAIGYASVVDIQIYAKTLTIGPHLPGVRDIALWTTDQMRAYVDADRTARAQADSVCYDYAKQIAESMWATHYKADAPHWESCDSLMGVLSQISNMMCGLSRAPADSVTAPAADSYVQPVPDKCDRIVWRDHYYHLPLTPPAQAADSVTAPAATPTAASLAWSALRDLTDPLGEDGMKIMGHVRVFAQRRYEAGLAEGSAAPPIHAAGNVLEDAGGANWQDISTAPKDGTRFVAVGNNYGLYSEPQHTCIAQWFRGCWMDVSEWNETSELKYLTHWMPLLPLPGTAARKQGGA